MSLMQTIVTTVARYWPDKKRDPLIDHAGFVGKPVERVDALAKVTGEARFTAEFRVGNLVYAVLVPSTIARGKVVKIDTADAKKAAGVVAVVTHENAPKMKAPPIADFNDLGKGVALSDLPIMQDATIHWDGEPVAVVVAETLDQASYAASLIHVDYEALPAGGFV